MSRAESMKTRQRTLSSILWRLFLLAALGVFVIVATISVYRPDTPIAPIVPGSSADPSFVVQVIRPREGLPLGGLLPPQLFGVDAKLGFDSGSPDSRYALENHELRLSGGDWDLRIVLDAEGQVQPGSEVLFDLVFEDQVRRVRCKPGSPAAGTLEMTEVAPDEFSGNFAFELPVCEDAKTGRSLGWPPKPFILRGSFDRLAMNPAQGNLPAWLQVRPDGWSDEHWKEYQSALIELRAPLLRRGDYNAQELAMATAEVEHLPGDYEDHIVQEWHDKWDARLAWFERTGGCGCCNEVYTVTGPKAAIEEFPVHRGRREYFPRYHDVKLDE